jgi:hypothetical protein
MSKELVLIGKDIMDMKFMQQSNKNLAGAINCGLKQAYDIVNGCEKYKNNRIMVVDDEEFCIASMKSMLFSAGVDTEHQVDFCITG